MELFDVYYIEVNVICIILMAYVYIMYSRDMRGTTEAVFFKAVIIEIIIYCISDMLAAVCKGENFYGVRGVLWLSNAVYISMPLLMNFTWGQYIITHTAHLGNKRSIFGKIYSYILLVVFVLSILSPFTRFSFYLDEANLYHRAWGAYIVPVLGYLFLIYDAVKLRILSQKIDSMEDKRDVNILAVFAMPCILFSLFQVFFYGFTTAQVGATISLLIVYLLRQQSKISKDELTGLDNRREYENRLDHISRNAEKLFVCMIDVDFFKEINDRLGHLAGDNALKQVACILSKACEECKNEGRFYLSRYGGDEFVIFASDYKEGADEILSNSIHDELDLWNDKAQEQYSLSLSVGIACGNITGKEDVKGIISKADSEMYKVKRKTHRRR